MGFFIPFYLQTVHRQTQLWTIVDRSFILGNLILDRQIERVYFLFFISPCYILIFCFCFELLSIVEITKTQWKFALLKSFFLNISNRQNRQNTVTIPVVMAFCLLVCHIGEILVIPAAFANAFGMYHQYIIYHSAYTLQQLSRLCSVFIPKTLLPVLMETAP